MRFAPLSLALLSLLPSACGPKVPPEEARQSTKPGSMVQCADGPRQALDCSSEFSYDGRKVEGSVQVLNVGAQGATEKTAIRRIDEQVEKFVSTHSRLCRDYNACILSAEEYKQRTAELEQAVMPLAKGADAFAAAGTYAERQKALADIYTSVVPIDQRVEEITFRMALEAELPASAGGRLVQVAPGDAVPTNARVAFTFEVSRDAFLYIFQKSPLGEPTVLFPDPRIGASNPLPGGTPRRIPPGTQRFRVNEKDVGVEHIYIVVSGTPLASLDAALAQVVAGKVTNVANDKSLTALSQVSQPAAAGCAPPGDTRALELDGGGCTRGLELDGGPEPATLVARTDPGDGIIVKAFAFNHVTEADWQGTSAAATPPPAAAPAPARPATDPRKRGMGDEDELIMR